MSNLVLATLGWLVGWYLLWRVRLIPTASGRSVPYAVIIPARNEAHNIAPLVEQVRNQTVAPAEVVVVDDDSSDATAAVAEEAGATVVRSAGLPVGWVGKTWACHQGAAATTAPLVVFLDADVRVAPDALGNLTRLAAGRSGLLSVVPYHTVHRPYEWLSLFFTIVSVMGVGLASAHRSRITGAFGPCIVMSREDYRTIGGHAAIAGAVIDDIELARRTVDAGLPVEVLGGGPQITYRMYPKGARSLVEGWTKNIASGAGRIPVWRTLAIALWICGAASAVLVIAQWPVVGVGWTAAWVFQLARQARQLGSFPLASFLAYPVLLIAFVVLFARSLVLAVLRRPVKWRDRTISAVAH